MHDTTRTYIIHARTHTTPHTYIHAHRRHPRTHRCAKGTHAHAHIACPTVVVLVSCILDPFVVFIMSYNNRISSLFLFQVRVIYSSSTLASSYQSCSVLDFRCVNEYHYTDIHIHVHVHTYYVHNMYTCTSI